jgi:hypothetical protein
MRLELHYMPMECFSMGRIIMMVLLGLLSVVYLVRGGWIILLIPVYR